MEITQCTLHMLMAAAGSYYILTYFAWFQILITFSIFSSSVQGQVARYSWSDVAQQRAGGISDGLRMAFLNEATESLDLIKLRRAFQSTMVRERMSTCSSRFEVVDWWWCQSHNALYFLQYAAVHSYALHQTMHTLV